MTDLQEAFREAARREFAMVPDESELDYTFSPGFQRKMQRIIRAQVHGYWNMVNTVGKRIAIVAAIIVMLLTTAMAIKPVRERVIKFFVDIYEEYFEITFGETQSKDLDPTPQQMTRYSFSWMPDGYDEIGVKQDTAFIRTHWKKADSQGIYLIQEPGTQEITLDHSTTNPTIILFEDLKITSYVQDGVLSLMWEQDAYIFLLTVYDDLDITQVLQVVSSLEPT